MTLDYFISWEFPVSKNTKVLVLVSSFLFNSSFSPWPRPWWFETLGRNYVDGDRLYTDFNHEQKEVSIKQVCEVALQEIDALNGDSSWLWIGGFSQGSWMASSVAFALEPTIGGILLMHGGIEPATYIKDAWPDKKGIKIIYFASQIDETVPIDYMRKQNKKLIDNGFKPIFKVSPNFPHYPMNLNAWCYV